MKKARLKAIFCAAVFMLMATASGTAQASRNYNIKLTKDTGGLDIVVQTFSGPAVTVGLQNHSAKTARCTASFVTYQHRPSQEETMATTIKAGKKAALGYPTSKLGGAFSTVFVNVKCAEKKSAH